MTTVASVSMQVFARMVGRRFFVSARSPSSMPTAHERRTSSRRYGCVPRVRSATPSAGSSAGTNGVSRRSPFPRTDPIALPAVSNSTPSPGERALRASTTPCAVAADRRTSRSAMARTGPTISKTKETEVKLDAAAPIVADHHQVLDAIDHKKILMVVANPSVNPKLGWPLGFWAAELMHPYFEFAEAGFDVTVASPSGGKV